MKVIILLLAFMIPLQDEGPNPEIAKWEEAIGELERRQKSEPSVENGILFYGSSSIRLWKTLASDMSPWPIIQRGYGGAKLPDIVHFSPRVLCPHLGPNNPKRCQAIVLFVANDIASGPSDASPQQVATRFSNLLSWIRTQDASIPVFWIEVTPTNSRWDVWRNVEESTREIGNIIGRDRNAYLISTAGPFLGTDGKPRPELFVDDQLHLNELGYQQWTVLIKAQLHAQLGPASPTKKNPGS